MRRESGLSNAKLAGEHEDKGKASPVSLVACVCFVHGWVYRKAFQVNVTKRKCPVCGRRNLQKCQFIKHLLCLEDSPRYKELCVSRVRQLQ